MDLHLFDNTIYDNFLLLELFIEMLFLMRHGERADDACEKNPDEIPEKLEDPHLTQHGKIQAKAAGDKIKEMVTAKNIQKVKVVSSPFVRCLQTAQEVCRRLGVEEIAVDNTLSEMMHHTFYKESPKETIFLTNEDCYKKYVDIPLKKLEKPFPPFPETFPEFANRAIAFFNHY